MEEHSATKPTMCLALFLSSLFYEAPQHSVMVLGVLGASLSISGLVGRVSVKPTLSVNGGQHFSPQF